MMIFSYGSNMNPRQIRARCPSARLIGRARLPDHELRFAGYSDRWQGGVATIVHSRGQHVEGLVHSVLPQDASRLDRFEGVPWMYRRQREVVHLLNEGGTRCAVARVWAYCLPRTAPRRPPSLEYFTQIEDAYLAHGFDVTRLCWAMIGGEF